MCVRIGKICSMNVGRVTGTGKAAAAGDGEKGVGGRGIGGIQHSSTQKIKSEIAKTAAPASAAHHPLRLLYEFFQSHEAHTH